MACRDLNSIKQVDRSQLVGELNTVSSCKPIEFG